MTIFSESRLEQWNCQDGAPAAENYDADFLLLSMPILGY
jgi:hypothetical protein